MTEATEVQDAADAAVKLDRRLRKMWRPLDVLGAVVVGVVFCAVLWVGVTTGVDYIHVGHTSCVFSHDGYSQMHWQCGTNGSGVSSQFGNTP